jgi:tetratricopeptide (TPR) repeat protein
VIRIVAAARLVHGLRYKLHAKPRPSSQGSDGLTRSAENLGLLSVECPKCRRAGSYSVRRLLEQRGREPMAPNLPTRAKLSQPWKWGLDKESPPYQQISGCTTVMQSGKESPKDLSIAFTNRGNAYHAKGDNGRAIADYSEAIRLNPQYSAAYTGRGDAHNDTYQYDRAIADYTEAINLNPTEAAAYYGRANA